MSRHATSTAVSRSTSGTSPQRAGPLGRSRGSGQDWKAKKELDRLERRLEKLTARESELHALLAAHAADYGKLLALNEELKSTEAERAQVEEDWLTLADDLG